jgi:hypothetical protein
MKKILSVWVVFFVAAMVFSTITVAYAKKCGNGKCESGETCATCAQDCGACPPVCGNGKCEVGESCLSCTADCCTIPSGNLSVK